MLKEEEIDPKDVTVFDDMMLGTGGFASVHVAEYQGTAVAAKIISIPHVSTDEKASNNVAKMFVCELHAMLRLRSEHTANVFGAVTAVTGRFVLIMELMEGEQALGNIYHRSIILKLSTNGTNVK